MLKAGATKCLTDKKMRLPKLHNFMNGIRTGILILNIVTLPFLMHIIITYYSHAYTLSTISGTGSMLPLMDVSVYPNLLLYYNDFNGEPIIGRIYGYEKFTPDGNETLIIHVLDHTWVDKKGQKLYYFKGINNQVIDLPVSKEQIKYELARIDYLP